MQVAEDTVRGLAVRRLGVRVRALKEEQDRAGAAIGFGNGDRQLQSGAGNEPKHRASDALIRIDERHVDPLDLDCRVERERVKPLVLDAELELDEVNCRLRGIDRPVCPRRRQLLVVIGCMRKRG